MVRKRVDNKLWGSFGGIQKDLYVTDQHPTIWAKWMLLNPHTFVEFTRVDRFTLRYNCK